MKTIGQRSGDNDVCIVLTYYSPYVSGLTNVARDLAEGLAKRGQRVTVIASQHDSSLPSESLLNGVRVLRVPVSFRIGKGVVCPSLLRTVRAESARSRVLNIHAPMLEAGLIALVSKCPVVTTYQCDVSLPPTIFGRLQNTMLDFSMRLAARRSYCVTVSSEDYANHSRLSGILQRRMVAISPTCHLRKLGNPGFRDGSGLHVGFLGRIVEEKGVEYLVEGFRSLPYPDARLLIAGDFDRIAGGGVIERVRQRIDGDPRIRLLGFLRDDELDDFYASLDVFALPSVNPFEAFGIVQVEAMMLGLPVIATDMPGVRQPVLRTGMGCIVPVRSADAIRNALISIPHMNIDRQGGTALAQQYYRIDTVLDAFEGVFKQATDVTL